jgi:two-component system chemotaxis response regulator CheB
MLEHREDLSGGLAVSVVDEVLLEPDAVAGHRRELVRPLGTRHDETLPAEREADTPFASAAAGDNALMDETASTVVVVGASAGGVEALTTLAEGLPAELDAAVCVVLHLPAGADSRLAEIISRAGPLPATQARGDEPLTPGRVYVAPPDRHLVLRDGQLLVVRGPHENGFRPSIDVLFRSAAVSYGRRTIAVVLSGTRDDGVAGASAVGARGGCVVVQSPDDALFPGMPAETVSRDHPDRVLPLRELASAVAAAVRRLSEEAPMSENGRDEMSLETEYATLDAEMLDRDAPPGESSVYSCPDCGGVLWELDDPELLRFRCRVGHAYTADGVVDGQGETVETALWTALRALQERSQLCDRLATRLGRRGAHRSRERFEALAGEAREQAESIRRLLAGADGAEG